MKLEELMIGDWILWKSDSPKNEFPIQVTLEMMQNELKKWNDRFRFIPITSEILEKNGFESQKQDFTEKLYKLKQELLYLETYLSDTEQEYKVGCSIVDYNHLNIHYRKLSSFCTIRYAHELQHTLRLCKIDKEIEL